MGYSTVAADRILLDLKSLVLSLMFLRIAKTKKQDEIFNKLSKSIEDDVIKINRASHLLGSFEAYHKTITPKDIERVKNLIEIGNVSEADREIYKLNTILGEELSEGFSTTRHRSAIRPISF